MILIPKPSPLPSSPMNSESSTIPNTSSSFYDNKSDARSSAGSQQPQEQLSSTKQRKVHFKRTVGVRYIETKEEMPKDAYWLTPLDLYHINNDLQKALRQQDESVQKYQPKEINKINRKHKSLTRSLLKEQQKHKKQQKKHERQQQKDHHRRSNGRSIWGSIMSSTSSVQSGSSSSLRSQQEKQQNTTAIDPVMETLRNDEIHQLSSLVMDATSQDREHALQVARTLEKELQRYDENDFIRR